MITAAMRSRGPAPLVILLTALSCGPAPDAAGERERLPDPLALRGLAPASS